MMLGITHRSNRDPITAVMVTSDTLDLFQNFAESSGAARVGDRIQKTVESSTPMLLRAA